MNKSDMIHQTDKYWAYAVIAYIWGKELKVQIGTGFQITEDQMDDFISTVEKRIEFINNSRSDIEKALIDKDAVDMANDWAESAEPDDDDENCYIMEDGTKVHLPITEEYFLSTVHIDEAAIEFRSSLDDVKTTVFVVCIPDFFAGHAFEVRINKDNIIDRCAFYG